MPRIEQALMVAAPPEKVYSVARNVEQFPLFMEDLQSLTILEGSPQENRTVTEWVGIIRAFKMKLRWKQEDIWNDAELRDDFRQLEGDLDRMEGSWVFAPQPDGATRFESVVDYEINVPMVGPMVKGLVKKLMTENLQATLEAIAKRAEEEN